MASVLDRQNESESRLDSALTSLILLSIEEGVTIYDTEMRLVSWNDRYASMGITPAESLTRGLHINDVYRMAAELGVFGPGDPEKIARERIRQIRAKESPEVEDLRGSDGRTIEIRRYFLPDWGVVAVFSDVTELRHSQTRLLRSDQQKLLARAMGGFAHDLKNHLHAIINALECMDSESNTPELSQLIELASRSGMSAAELTKTITGFANPRSEAITDQKKRFSVRTAIDETLKWCRLTLPPGIIVTHEESDSNPFLYANRARFCSSLLNLLLNAFDAMPRGGRVTIRSTQESGEAIRVSVTDDGCGIPDSIRNKVLEPFFKTKGKAVL